jgi:transcriptional regulator of acetoin/glycerol metabolism
MVDPVLESKIQRRRAAERAWQQFVQDRIAPQGLREEISRSWLRVRESYGIDPGLTQPIHALSSDALEERRANDEVLQLASPILDDFADLLPGHVLAYLDGEGWLLTLGGDPRIVERVAEIHFQPGINWAEDSAGTNGPGTALASARPVEVFSAEHFVAAWQGWSCAAAPLLVPGTEEPVGLIDVTGPWDRQSRQAMAVAKAIARTVQERLRAAASVRAEVVRHALRAARDAGDALVAVDARGRVIAMNDAAQRRRMAESGVLPLALRDRLGQLFSSSSSSSRAEGDLPLQMQTGQAAVASPVRFDGSTVGALLRVPSTERAARPPRAQAGPSARYHFGRILGQSEALRHVLELARSAARNDLPVVLSGESGTGKELFAHSIHAASAREAGPFVVVNCGSIPEELIQAELFGYESGAFTGAKRTGNAGRFEDADGGTLLLDEVSELPPQAQTALLRLLQEKEVVRLGGSAPRRVDVRVLAATNKPLEEEIRAKRFRRDLYYRLNVLKISVPPLRERGDDVALLSQLFLAEAEGEVGRSGLTLSPDALAALRAHRWPGNVRELRNVILRAAAMAPGAQISVRDLLFDVDPLRQGQPMLEPSASASASGGRLRDALLESERVRIQEALDASSWNFARTAIQLGISRVTLYRLLRKHGISRTSRQRP